jgi:hypothetical protein
MYNKIMLITGVAILAAALPLVATAATKVAPAKKSAYAHKAVKATPASTSDVGIYPPGHYHESKAA